MIRWDDNPHIGPPFDVYSEYLKEQARFRRAFRLQRDMRADRRLSLFGDNGVSPNDIVQGWIGNHWLLSAIGAMAEVPGRVENIFINTEVNSKFGISRNGIYALNLYALMMPIVVTIDDRLP